MNFSIVFDNLDYLLEGTVLTIWIFVRGVVFGLALALLMNYLRTFNFKVIDYTLQSYVILFRGTPLLLQLFFIYYGLALIPGIRDTFLFYIIKDPEISAVTALTLNTAAYVSEVIRGAFAAINKGVREGATALALGSWHTLRHITGPLALRNGLSGYGNELVLLFKSSSLASTIAVLELTGVARRLISQSFAVIEVFIAIGMIYLFFNLLIAFTIRYAEARLNRAGSS